MPGLARAGVFFLLALLVFFVALRSFGRARYGYGWSPQASNWYGYGVLILGVLLVATLVAPGTRFATPLVSVVLLGWLFAPPVLRKLGWPSRTEAGPTASRKGLGSGNRLYRQIKLIARQEFV
jgi:hypothetical protein